MTNDKKLADELLKQNGLERKKVSEQNRQQTQEMLSKELKRHSRFKRAAKILLLIMVLWPAIVFILAEGSLLVMKKGRTPPVVELIIIGWYVLGICAVVCAIIAYTASRALSMKQIQASLTDISEELKRQSRDS